MRPLSLLVVEDDADAAALLEIELRRGGFDPVLERVDSAKAMRGALARRDWDLVLCDFTLPGFSMAEALALVRSERPDVPFVVVSGTIGEETTVESLHAGVRDVVPKSNLSRLIPIVTRELEDREVRRRESAARAALDESEERFRRLAENAPDIIFRIALRPEPGFEYISPACTQLSGYTPDDFYDDRGLLWRIVDPGDRPCLERILRSRTRVTGTLHGRHRSGAGVWVEIHAVPVLDGGGEVVAFEGVARDITEQQRSREALRRSEEFYRAVIGTVPVGILVSDREGSISFLSESAGRLLGLSSADDAVGSSVLGWVAPESRDQAAAAVRLSKQGGRAARSLECVLQRLDGSAFWAMVTTAPLHDTGGGVTGNVVSLQDISERKLVEERLTHLAYHDAVTGLPNRQLFTEQAETAVVRARHAGRAVAVLLLKLKGLKLVNESLGLDAGDGALREAAARLRSSLSAEHSLARDQTGGFLVLLGDLDPASAEAAVRTIAGRLGDVIRAPFLGNDAEFFLDATVGVSLWPDGGDVFPPDCSESLVREARIAIGEARLVERDRVHIYSRTGVEPAAVLARSTQLRHAVERGELRLHYQPIIDLAGGEGSEWTGEERSGSAIMAEALVRWQRPTGELLLPGEFIPIAEQTGLIEEIGGWVIREACRQVALWREEGLEVAVSVNLSARQFGDPAVAQSILDAVEAAGIEPRCLLVEITEATAVQEPEHTRRVLERLRANGVRVGFDDFGTGYSSLGQLIDPQVDILKIDRSFVEKLPDDRSSARLVDGILAIARGLDLLPIAEGVETASQWRFLIEHGCPRAQGFYFAPPLPPGELSEWLLGVPVRTVDGRAMVP